MEKFNNIYMYNTCEEERHIPKEIETMYFKKYGRENKRKFFRSLKH